MERQRGGRANSKTGLLTEHTAIAPEDRKIIILVQALKKRNHQNRFTQLIVLRHQT